jgi:hypothetical protein
MSQHSIFLEIGGARRIRSAKSGRIEASKLGATLYASMSQIDGPFVTSARILRSAFIEAM